MGELDGSRGEVEYTEHRPVFEMLAEAFGGRGRDVSVEVAAVEDDTRAPLLGSEPTPRCRALLPPKAAFFESRQDNFGFYKVCLLHQLGYLEFGCIDALPQVEAMVRRLGKPRLARLLFTIAEDARVDWALARRFRGLQGQLARQKRAALMRRVHEPLGLARWLEAMIRAGLDGPRMPGASAAEDELIQTLHELVASLAAPDATVRDSLAVTVRAYRLIGATGVHLALEELPVPVEYRGETDLTLDMPRAMAMALSSEELAELDAPQGEDPIAAGGVIDKELLDEIEEIERGQDVSDGLGVMAEDRDVLAEPGSQEAVEGRTPSTLGGALARAKRKAKRYHYDEWDYELGDYLPDWCILHEIRDMEPDEAYVADALQQHGELASRVRRQLLKMKPGRLVRVKGMPEGEELDLERAITWVVDRKAGLTPDDRLHVQRQRRERDVSTLFLLDMSASTNDIISDPDAEPKPPDEDADDDAFAHYFNERRRYEESAMRIIDVEKQAVALMAQALEWIGDSYSVCGFSGYGRESVEYYLCKDFDEPLDAAARGRIGGIKARRSTRMGPAIRHATRSLLRTGSRVKGLIIISDGYPQDHDYGADRGSREYGLQDTTRALAEARRQGVLSHCLTVDPSGHDYLRAMCEGSEYMVIQDVAQLPEELSRVYRRLTGH